MNNNRKILAVLAVAVFAVALVPTTNANVGQFGTFAEGFQVDIVHPTAAPAGVGTLAVAAATGFCFVDADGDAAFDDGETAYLRATTAALAGTVQLFYLRLTPAGSLAAFTQVKSTDTDFGAPCTIPVFTGAVLKFYDFNGDGAWSANDHFYIDTDAVLGGGGRVTAGDVRIANDQSGALASGTRVNTGNADENRNLIATAGPPVILFFDADRSGGYNLGDVLYVDQAGGAGFVAAEDLRLGNLGGNLAAGKPVKADDADVTHVLSSGGFAAPPLFGFVDDNGNGAYDDGETMYLDLDGAATVTIGDIRLTARGTFAAGSQVVASDSDAGSAHTAPAVGAGLAAALAFYDNDGNNAWSVDDWVYIDTDASASVSPGDVRISAAGSNAAGTRVATAASDETRPLAVLPFAPTIEFFNADNSANAALVAGLPVGYNIGDTVYLVQTAASAAPRQEDLRFNKLGTSYGIGQFVKFDSADIVYARVAAAGAAFGFLDDNGNGAYDSGERMYLDGLLAAAGAVSVGDILVSAGSGTGTPGSQILGSDPQISSVLVGAGAIAFYDNNGDNAWSVGDHIYVDNAPALLVSANDVRLNAAGAAGAAGSRVGSGASDEGRTLRAAPGGSAFGFFNVDLGAGYNVCDHVYFSQGAVGANFLVEDFRFAGTASACANQANPTPVTTTSTTGTTTSTSGTTTSTSGTTSGTQQTTTTGSSNNGSTTKKGNETPGFELVALVAALAAALVLVRRKL